MKKIHWPIAGHLVPFMGKGALREFSDEWILAHRGARNALNPWRPYEVLLEKEYIPSGKLEAVLTLFLTNRECPFRCLMCDLWKNTTEKTVPIGALPAQIEWGIQQSAPAAHVKLYNSGNFFDTKAVPPADIPQIANLMRDFETVIVECHPKLIGPSCFAFNEQIHGHLQVAMGLESIHPSVVERLNKRMTPDDFARACEKLLKHDISIRTFILLNPPFLEDYESLDWAIKTIDFAFACGVECCAIIPTRVGNGAMEVLAARGEYEVPEIRFLQAAVEYGIALKKGRVFADLWDIEKFVNCNCDPVRIERLKILNNTQVLAENLLYCEECEP